MIVSSFASVALVVTTAYTVPNKSLGIVTCPSLISTNSLSSPVKNATHNGPEEPPASKVTLTVDPGFALAMVRAGKAFTGSVGFVGGHDLMKGAASENTSFRPRGTFMN
jgi:hypothetical protein